VRADRLEFRRTSLLGVPERELRGLLGTSMAMVFQDPMTSFNPTLAGRTAAGRGVRTASGPGSAGRVRRAVDRLRAVQVPAAQRRARQYPHEFSGGMRQRAMIGWA